MAAVYKDKPPPSKAPPPLYAESYTYGKTGNILEKGVAIGNPVGQATGVVITGMAANAVAGAITAPTVGPKVGAAGGPGAGKGFSPAVKDAARAESGNTCVFCGTETTRSSVPSPTRSNIDHAIPKSLGGNNTIMNAQNTCQTCNLSKGTMTTSDFIKFISNQ